MSFDFHKDKNAYFEMQRNNAASYVLPFVEKHMTIDSQTRVLEIGCAEAGVLKAFLDKGARGLGIELQAHRTALAEQFLATEVAEGRVSFLNKNIYDIQPEVDLQDTFDLIVLKDVIEHIPDQEKFIPILHRFLKPGGMVFFGFPPWYMPFGGHQQICTVKWLSVFPWLHLLPMRIYTSLLKWAGEKEHVRLELAEIKETGISLERFERISKGASFDILDRKLWLINPIYALKFKLSPRLLPGFLGIWPFLRNFYTTAAFYIIQSKQ